MVVFRNFTPTCEWLEARVGTPSLQSLKFRLILSSAALSIVILFIVTSILSHETSQAVAREARSHAVDMTNYFSEAVAESVAVEDRLQIHVLAQSILNNGVDAVTITGSGGAALFKANSEVEAAPPAEGDDQVQIGTTTVATVRHEGRTYLRASKEIVFGEKPVGTLHAWLDRSEVEQRIASGNAAIYPIFVLGFVAMLLLGLAELHTPFRALKRLSVVAEEIRAGDVTVRVPVEGSDEIARFCRTFNVMVDGLVQTRAQFSREHLQVIEAMISAVEAKDRYTEGHCVRVQEYARDIMTELGIAPEEKAEMTTAALLHDIGKIGIPDVILQKQDALTPEEMEVVRSHVVIGENILLHLDSMKEIGRWIRHHHERWDGEGYPDGLSGKTIPLASRIIAAADTIDAMLTRCPPGQERSADEILAAFEEGKGKQFDPEVYECARPILVSKLKTRDQAELPA